MLMISLSVGEQDQLDGMKSELDKLYVMKTSGFIPSKYDPEVEPLRFLGCLIERIPSGQIIMHPETDLSPRVGISGPTSRAYLYLGTVSEGRWPD